MKQQRIPGLQREAMSQVRLSGILKASLLWGVFSNSTGTGSTGFQRLQVKELDDGTSRVSDLAGIVGLWKWQVEFSHSPPEPKCHQVAADVIPLKGKRTISHQLEARNIEMYKKCC